MPLAHHDNATFSLQDGYIRRKFCGNGLIHEWADYGFGWQWQRSFYLADYS